MTPTTDTPLLDWTPPAVRNTDPDTSWFAAQGNAKGRANDRRRVLAEHYQHPDGLTDFELAELLHRQQTSVGKRRGELRDLGLIEDTGLRRKAPSGSAAIVWRVTERGRRLVRGIR